MFRLLFCAVFVCKLISSLLIQFRLFIKSLLFFRICYKFALSLRDLCLMENTICALRLWAGVILSIRFLRLIKWLLGWLNLAYDRVPIVKGMIKIVMLFWSWYLFYVWTWSFCVQILTELILDKISNKHPMSVLIDRVKDSVGGHCGLHFC